MSSILWNTRLPTVDFRQSFGLYCIVPTSHFLLVLINVPIPSIPGISVDNYSRCFEGNLSFFCLTDLHSCPFSGVASAAKAAAQAASEALVKAEAVSLATETSQRDALAGALARSSRTEQTLANLESAVVEVKAAQGKSFAEMLAAAAAGEETERNGTERNNN